MDEVHKFFEALNVFLQPSLPLFSKSSIFLFSPSTCWQTLPPSQSISFIHQNLSIFLQNFDFSPSQNSSLFSKRSQFCRMEVSNENHIWCKPTLAFDSQRVWKVAKSPCYVVCEGFEVAVRNGMQFSHIGYTLSVRVVLNTNSDDDLKTFSTRISDSFSTQAGTILNARLNPTSVLQNTPFTATMLDALFCQTQPYSLPALSIPPLVPASSSSPFLPISSIQPLPPLPPIRIASHQCSLPRFRGCCYNNQNFLSSNHCLAGDLQVSFTFSLFRRPSFHCRYVSLNDIIRTSFILSLLFQ
jgi:hypothetical protein